MQSEICKPFKRICIYQKKVIFQTLILHSVKVVHLTEFVYLAIGNIQKNIIVSLQHIQCSYIGLVMLMYKIGTLLTKPSQITYTNLIIHINRCLKRYFGAPFSYKIIKIVAKMNCKPYFCLLELSKF